MKYLKMSLPLALSALTCLQTREITKGSIAGFVRDPNGAVTARPVKDRTKQITHEGA